ncbi:MAG: TonB-dependent receptor [Xanthomonadales bacterium]|nr:TonB-dependent receptor [Xanthomonadales bacterium]
MYKRKPLSLAMATALGVFSAGSMLATSVYAADDADQADDEALLEEVVVTGSRIARTMDTQSQEIITFTAEDMQLAGDISVTDALRSSTMNSFGSFRESSGSSAQSNATLNLRGVGSSRTLILINGRRAVGSPSLGGGGTFNLNMIPFAAVDRIEVIADGASAVYGSDAIAGVVNVILQKNYDGMTITTRYGDRQEDDGTEFSASVLMGASNDRASITYALEYDKRDPIFDADRPWTAASAEDLDGDGIITGYAETTGISFYGYTLVNPDYDPDVAYDPNDRSTWYVTPGANCGFENGFQGEMEASAVFGPDSGFYCGYAYALVSANRAGLERINNWVSGTYELTDNIDLYADAIFANNSSFGRYAPPAATGPTIPGDPRNDIGATTGYFRWVDIGTRDNTVDDNLIDINVGLKGDTDGSISWDVYYTYSSYVSSSVGSFYLNYAGLAYNVAYDIDDFDTFVNNIKHTTINNDKQELWKVFGGMQFDMFEMNAGTATAYISAEYFEIDYAALVDAQSEAGLVGGSAGNSAEGFRDVTAFAFEAIFPIAEWMELDTALRYDNYSDFGSAWSPRIGAIMHIPSYEPLTFKVSWGQGFRAPNLSDLYGATAFSAESATDNWGCSLAGQDPCNSRQFDTYIGSNPDLDAEKSSTWSVGAEWRFADRWMTSLNWFSLDIKDPINYTSAQDQLDVDFQTQGNNPNVERNANGGVTRIDAGFQNGTTTFNYQALDWALSGGFETGWGDFGMQAHATYYINYDAELSYGTGELYDAAGTLGLPEWRANLLLPWSMGDWFASLNWDYIGESKSNISDVKWKAWSQFNIQAGYSFEKYGTFTVGANNAFNKKPIRDQTGNVSENLYPNVGRVWFVRYSVDL